jgi:NADPH:quinone reductase-like Zn-dependent oxidoreductase
MKAIQFSELGDPDVLTIVDVAEPHAPAGTIRIRVKAASVNPVDWKVRSGASKRPVPVELPSIPGMDAAGVVDEIGEGVDGVSIGDEVFGAATSGAYAEFVVLDHFARKPAAMSWTEAAGLPSAVETAFRGLAELGVEPGETIVVNGAAGGVGIAAVQLAIALGATVIGTASEANHEYLRSLGVIPTTYGQGLVDRVLALAPSGVDRALDATGHGALPDLVSLAHSKERVLTLADPQAFELGIEFSTGANGRSFEALAEVAALSERGAFTMPIAKEFPLDEAPAAHRLSESGHFLGKIVLVV